MRETRPHRLRRLAVCSLLLASAVPGDARAVSTGDGADSLASALTQIHKAAGAGKAQDLLAVVHPDDRINFARQVAMLLPLTMMAHLDDEKATDKAKNDIDALFARYKITAPLTAAPAEIFKGVDITAFVGDAMTLLKSQLPQGQTLASALGIPTAVPSGASAAGDAVEIKNGDDTYRFARVNGRWFFRVPATLK